MNVIKIEHGDFTLTVECKDLRIAYNRARSRHFDFASSTSYYISEGSIKIFDLETDKLMPLASGLTHPVFFENKEYFINILFKKGHDIQQPYIFCQTKDVEDKFFYNEELFFIAGTINFGNDIGKSDLILRYQKDGVSMNFSFGFEVFPTKIDYKNSYNKIVADIENEYPLLVLGFLKKTYSAFKTGGTSSTDLVWWQIFSGLCDDLIKASRFVLNKPHSRIISENRYIKADKLIFWTPALEEAYFMNKHLDNKVYFSPNKTLSANTPENRLFKYIILQTSKKYKRIKDFINVKFSGSITLRFREEMSQMEMQIEKIANNPFFRSIGEFKGIRQESLILQRASGYNDIYRSWIMLNSGLKFLEGIQKVELKNIAELYQIWCFLEIKKTLQKILGKKEPDNINLAIVSEDDLVFKIERGIKSMVSYRQNNGDVIELFHDHSYIKTGSNEVKTFTINQRPDIVLRVLKNDLKENYALTYLFDAKYRLMSDDREGSPDLPPEDAINQMHRYRDAIYYQDRSTKAISKEVIGGYVLFPGLGDPVIIKDLDYYKSIEMVNIGAFPLSPMNYQTAALLQDHLSGIISAPTEDILSDIIPQKEMTYESANPDVLVGFVNPGVQEEYFNSGSDLIYHTGTSKPSRFGYASLKYFAPYFGGKGIKEYFEILDYSVLARREIFPKNHLLYKGDDLTERLVLKLGRRYIIAKGEYFKCNARVRTFCYTKLGWVKNPVNNEVMITKVRDILKRQESS